MIVKEKTQPFIVDKKPHFKMYKSGKLWLTAMVTTLTLAGAGVTTVAHADENTTGANSSTAETKAGGNAVTSTTANTSDSQENSNGGSSTNSVPVNIDHSQLDQAVQKAKDSGITNVHQDPTQSATVGQDQINQKSDQITKDYSDQTQKINQQVDQYNHEKENIKKYDNAIADSTSLENAVKQAQSTPGITVIKDNPKISNIQADDNSVDAWKKDAESDYSKQVSDINNAIATQNQNNSNYEKEYAQYVDTINKLKQAIKEVGLNSDETGIDLAKLQQALAFNNERNAHIQIDSSYKTTNGTNNHTNLLVGTQNIPGDFATITWTNLNNTVYQGHKIVKVIAVLSDLKYNLKDGKYTGIVQIPNDPSGFFSISGNSLDIDYTYYDDNGNQITFGDNAYLSAGGMESWDHNGLDSEGVQLLSDGQALHLPGSSIMVHDGNLLYADTNNTDSSKGAKIQYGSRNFDNVENYYREGLFKVTGNHVKIRYTDIWSSPSVGNWLDNNGLHASDEFDGVTTNNFGGVTVPLKKSTELHYHFDVAKLHHSPANETINYHYTNLNVTTTPTKQWAEDGQNSDNKVYFNGDTAHASVSATLNGINNYDGIKNGFALTDDYSQLAPDATVTGATVTENGKDTTANYTLSVKDGKVTMTRNNTDGLQDGTYTLNVAFKLNDNVKAGTQLTNKGYLTIGDHQLDVTPKTVTTTTPDPHKDVDAGEVQGKGDKSINGQTVANGTLTTFPFTTANLPENRAKKITDRASVDTLDPHLTYQGFKAYVIGDDGKLEDVTSHIKLVQNGQTLTFTEDSYLINRYNADLSKAVTTPIIDVYAYVNGANVKIKNQYTLIQNGVKYTSNTVELTTPENPKPVKKDLNEQGVDINGKTVLPGSTNIYEVTADYDQYKGIQTSEDNIAKGFYIIDDYPEDALNADTSKLSAKDKDGKAVDGLTYTIYQSVDQAPKEVQAAIKRSGMQIKGAFIVAAAKDPMDYFTKYVQTGDSVTVSMPMIVKDAYNGTYTNTAYEVDFGQGYATNVVSNNVPKLTPTKSAEDGNGQTLQNNATIQIGQTFDYVLHGAIIPANEGHPLTQYGDYDDYDLDHDQYEHKYQAVLTTDVTLKDGTVLKKGTDVTKYVKETVDETNGAVDYEFDKEFLDQVDTDKSAFGADIRAFFTRIAAGDVKNQYTNWINGKPYLSNTFISHTPKPTPKPTPVTPKLTPKTPTPETPKPVVAAVTPAQPAPKKKSLPQTGNESSGLFGLGLMGLLMAIGSLGFGFKKKQKID
ncbi:SspB-related isopeptide-forming adhesin [uncultured Limosilactobacillus sp.]|uniref:SspB-related isopeptide-forming adhesin n=1 Tax=uncultured Limosilactobacillus sp. TaxID=2837629 RepID=UPI0025DBBCBC|nr:SspB-related isopeptide-forming adhesin [uncultured Limosilactobacillus sp.]